MIFVFINYNGESKEIIKHLKKHHKLPQNCNPEEIHINMDYNEWKELLEL